MHSVQKVKRWTGGYLRPLDPDRLRWRCLVPGRYAEPHNVKNLVAHPWSWAIGSSTSAAQRSFDMVVCRRKARPFVLITELGLRENGRPSPKGTALGPGSRWLG